MGNDVQVAEQVVDSLVRAMRGAAAVIDAEGTIVAVNNAWREFNLSAAPFGGRFEPGDAYRKQVESMAPWHGGAAVVAESLRRMLDEPQEQITADYDFGEIEEDRDQGRIRLSLSALVVDEQRLVLVLHDDLRAQGTTGEATAQGGFESRQGFLAEQVDASIGGLTAGGVGRFHPLLGGAEDLGGRRLGRGGLLGRQKSRSQEAEKDDGSHEKRALSHFGWYTVGTHE